MISKITNQVPLLYLLLISVGWGIYYSSPSEINNMGAANFEWLFMLDALIVLPVLCLFVEKNKQKASLKAAILCCTAIFIGSVIIPEHNKVIFHYLEGGRYVVLATILLLEFSTFITVLLAFKALLAKNEDPDVALQKPIERVFGRSVFSNLLQFESRMWAFAFFSSHIKSRAYNGTQHFYYDKKDGAQSNLLGFIALMIMELPLMHLVLHFTWSSSAANVVTGLTLFGLVFFFAEYKAVAKRPISIDRNKIIVRYGLYPSLHIPVSNIDKIEAHSRFVGRASGVKRFNYSGVPNVGIKLYAPINGKHTIYLGVDSPEVFISSVKQIQGAK